MCDPPEFTDFWSIYPARNGKKLERAETLRRFLEVPEVQWPEVVRAARNYAESELVKRGIGIKDPKRFLKNGNGSEPWRDWLEEERDDRFDFLAEDQKT